MKRHFGPCLALLLAASLPAAARTPSDAPLDQGTFTVHVGTVALGVETFSYRYLGDTLLVSAEVLHVRPTPEGPDTLRKELRVSLNRFDHALQLYHSVQRQRGHRLIRSVLPRDTTFTAFVEFDDRGEGVTYARPPGRLYVLDGMTFTLFDVMCRSLKGREFDRRTIHMFAFGARDSLLVGRVTDLGADTLRWGARPVVTRRLEFTDGPTRALVWMAPDGRMLRLEQPESRLRVERQPPPVKPAAARPRGR
jgi:hypothetical protein